MEVVMPKIFVLALFLALVCATPPGGAQAQNPAAEKIEQDVDISLLAEAIIQDSAQSAGLLASFGNPAWMIEAGKGNADVLVEFPRGPLPDLAAAEFALIACARLVQTSVEIKAPANRLGVTVTSPLPDGRVRVYGTAIYNGKLAAMIWENSGLNLEAARAPKVRPQNREAARESAPGVSPQMPPARRPGPQVAFPPSKMAPQTMPGQPVEEFVEEDIVMEEAAPGRSVGQPMREKRGARQFPQNMIPGAMGPKMATPPPPPAPGEPFGATLPPPPPGPKGRCPAAKTPLSGQFPPCPYAKGTENIPPESGFVPPCMRAGKSGENIAPQPEPKKRPPVGPRGRLQPRGPQAAAPAAPQGKPATAANSPFMQALLNDAAAMSNLQANFGNPAFTIVGDDNRTNLLAQFARGPLPENGAMNFGLMACDIIARSSIASDLAMRNLAVTVSSMMPDGAMRIYGTAFFNGNLDQIAWQEANLQIPAVPGDGKVGARPAPQRKPLNMRPGTISPGDHAMQRENVEQLIAQPEKKPMTRAERQKAKREARSKAIEQAMEQSVPQQPEDAMPAMPNQPAQKPYQMESNRERALDNVNEANQASYSMPVRPIVNAVVRSLGLQANYGMPENYVIGGNRQAQILLLFKRGPMPDASAASLGLMACEQLARAYIVKGLNTKNLAVTIAYTMEDGRRYDYGTAIFNGNLDDLAWVVVDHII